MKDDFFKHLANYIESTYNFINITPIVLLLDSFYDGYEVYYSSNDILQRIHIYKSEKPFFNILEKYNMENHRTIENNNILTKYKTLLGIDNSEEIRALVYATDYKSILFKYGPYFYLSENYKIDYTESNFELIDNIE